MNILFLTLLDFDSLDEHNIYTDLLRELKKDKNDIYVISPCERRSYKKERLIKDKNTTILKLKIGNIQKTNLLEKGISTITLEKIFIAGVKRFFSKVKFDLVLYSTPPITFQKTVEYIKKRDNSTTYLMLKDIFPQNAVDLGMLSKTGVKGILYKYFREKEKKLYRASDYIGCMSEANRKYILQHNKEINTEKVIICPNSIEAKDYSLDNISKQKMRIKYQLPLDKMIFVYGGNLGKPQDIPFIIKCLKTQIHNTNSFFLIVGDGTEYSTLESFFKKENPSNMKLLKRLAKEDYDRMIAACDVGMIFLDHRFTIPNFPSRLLSYMQAKLPVLAVTDINSDIGQVIVNGKFGWWCESNDEEKFSNIIQIINQYNDFKVMQDNEWKFLLENYVTQTVAENILKEVGE